MIAQKQDRDWVGEAVKEVVDLLGDDRSLSGIAEYIRAIGGADAAALELEALAFVATAVKTRQYSVNVKESGIDIKTNIGYYITRYTRYEFKATKNRTIERKIHYNVYMRFLGSIEAPQTEFLFLSYDGEVEHAELAVRVIPAGRPPVDTLWAVRRLIWAAANVKITELARGGGP